MRLTIISAVNSEEILKTCLLASPELNSGAVDIIIQKGYKSASDAYNSGIERAKTDILVFAHQDVYLPQGWLAAVETAIAGVSRQDPKWGVLGVWGVTKGGGRAGYLNWTGVDGVAGARFDGGVEVETLDECLLIIRKSSMLVFDKFLNGFHMYGTDICLAAQQMGMQNYAISTFCIHNTNEYRLLPFEFWKAYFYIRRKWKWQLPVRTTCVEITPYCLPMIKWLLSRSVILALHRPKLCKRLPDPSLLYQSLVQNGIVP